MTDTEKRLMWISNAPWAKTGYGTQTAQFAPKIKALGYEVAINAFYGLEGGIIRSPEGILVYPRGKHPYGLDVMSANSVHFRAQIAITLVDAWVLDNRHFHHTVRWAPWFPVDSNPLPNAVKAKIKDAWRRIVFSRFGERMVNNEGLDCYYVPHGVDTNVFSPLPMDKVREAMRWPQDKFIAVMVAANKGLPARKAFGPQLEAWADFSRKHKDTLLYIHTEMGNEGGGAQKVNLPELLDHLGVKWGVMGQCNPDDVSVLFSDPFSMILGYPDEYMNQVYNGADVKLLVSMGEGFGVPLVEAQASGAPVITGAWTATDELCFAGWKVEKVDSDPWWTPLGAYQFQPRRGAIVDALKKAYLAKGRQKFREQARAGAMAYDSQAVTDKYWAPVLKDMYEQLEVKDDMPKMVDLGA